jgi:polyferredoxin/Pyruvate/2-oxoacid:ferredoxin oxidoreductase delta subunit
LPLRSFFLVEMERKKDYVWLTVGRKLKTTRRIVQIFFLLFFIFLFLAASYPLKIKFPVDFFLRMDPLIALSSMISARAFIGTFIWAFFILVLTIPLGRYFCGWVCPLGTSLDVTSFIFKNKAGRSYPKLKFVKYAVLIFLLVGALFSSQLIWFLDPIALLTRSAAISVWPIITLVTSSVFGFAFRFAFLQDWLSSLQNLFSSTFLPEQITFFRMSGLVLLIFLAIIVAEFVSRRFWCRNLCPLGAFFALFSKFQLLKRKVSSDCTECGDCRNICKMDAIKQDFKSTEYSECIQCFDCVTDCPPYVTSINFNNRIHPYALDLGRRRVITSAVAGLVSVGILKTNFLSRNANASLIRPPGSREENAFLDRCIRCHECVKVCSTSGRFLQPAFLESGLEGMWTPVGVARYGYWEFNCNLCTQVCPTDAIHPLDIETKMKTVIGLAYIDKNRCIPWYKNENCLVCQEHCPTPTKAIELKEEKVVHFTGEERLVKRPYIREDLCIGCGICETKCPVAGRSAIIVTPQNEQRWTD